MYFIIVNFKKNKEFAMKILSLKNVKKEYHTGSVTVPALEDVSFDLNEGEFVVILGASGAGKTTLLNLLGGMDTVTDGKIVLDGNNIAAYGKRDLTLYRRRDVGFVFQFYNLVQNLTVRENVELATQICKKPLDIDEVIEAVGLKDRSNNFPAQLSGGEQQRIAIARALLNKPKIIIADEPTGNLDPETANYIVCLLRDICHTGTAVIMTTHNVQLLDKYQGVVYKCKDGHIYDVTGEYQNAKEFED